MGTSWITATKWALFMTAILLFFLRGECRPQYDPQIVVRSSKKVCGKTLSELVKYVCTNHIVDKRSIDRSIPDFMRIHPKMKTVYENDFMDFDDIIDEVKVDKTEGNKLFDPSLDYQMAFLKSVYNGALRPRWQNGKRFSIERETLTQECCIKGCSHSEILGYCDGKGGYRGFPIDNDR